MSILTLQKQQNNILFVIILGKKALIKFLNREKPDLSYYLQIFS